MALVEDVYRIEKEEHALWWEAYLASLHGWRAEGQTYGVNPLDIEALSHIAAADADAALAAFRRKRGEAHG